MTAMELLSYTSLLVGIVSIVLAIVAITYARSLEKDSRENFNRAQQLFAEIDKKTAIFQTVTSESQKQLLDTVTSLANPKKLEEQYGQVFMENMMHDPSNTQKLLDAFRNFAPATQRQNGEG